MNKKYCNNILAYSRWKTREVKVGDVGIGGDNPIRVQSMTTTETLNTKATVEQCVRMINAGCELVRITVPSIKEAENLVNIKTKLKKLGYKTPLIADIHFTPNAAELAARIVEKVRINPGNYADKKKFENIVYSDSSYNVELEKIRVKFIPLVKICKEYGTAMRIGTNHGSLSDRILSRYGDTPTGMVESAMEFLKICEDEQFYNIVLSMKASNTQVMVQAYRLLVNRMMKEGMNYPLHLGVTEAGDGEDGRIKSAVGIGTLLEDGLGDTIRVSLTEEPEFEIPVAKSLIKRYENRTNEILFSESTENPLTPFDYNKRKTEKIKILGGDNVPRIVADFSSLDKITPASLYAVGYFYSVPNDKWNIADFACDFLFAGNNTLEFEIPGTLGVICNYNTWKKIKNNNYYPYYSTQEFLTTSEFSNNLNFVSITYRELSLELYRKIKEIKNTIVVLENLSEYGIYEQRKVFFNFINKGLINPIIIKRNYSDLDAEKLMLETAIDFGALLIDGMGDGIWLHTQNCGGLKIINTTAFGILQATRTRISKTEYISCPSCGRTLFDLQETTAKIRAVTNHLKGIKIGIMGCIVNGPGEMADADYGYVGTGQGKITLYKEKNIIKKNIPECDAVDALVALIKENGDWVEKNKIKNE